MKKYYIIFKNGIKFFVRANSWRVVGAFIRFQRNLGSLTSGATTNATTTVTCASTSGLLAGYELAGKNIVPGTTVISITNATTFVISVAATGTASGQTFTYSDPAVDAMAAYLVENEVGAILEDVQGTVLDDLIG